MENQQQNKQTEPKDNKLDVPAEANRDKHINFRDLEQADSSGGQRQKDQEHEERQREWKQGLEEGNKTRENP